MLTKLNAHENYLEKPGPNAHHLADTQAAQLIQSKPATRGSMIPKIAYRDIWFICDKSSEASITESHRGTKKLNQMDLTGVVKYFA